MTVYYPTELTPVTQLTASAATVYTGVSNETVIIRTIWLNTAATGKTATVSRGTDASATRLLDAFALTQSVPSIFNMWLVIAEGSTVNIQAFASAVTSVNLAIGGYLNY